MLLLILLALSFGAPVHAAVQVLESGQDSVVVEVTSPAPVQTEVTIAGRRYAKLTVDGFASALPPGYPEVPSAQELLALPRGTVLRVEIEQASAQEMALRHDLSYAEAAPSHCHGAVKVKRNRPAYRRVYGNNTVKVEEQSFAASDKLARVSFWPVRYDARRRTLTWVPKARVRFHFVPEPALRGEEAPVSGTANSLAQYLALNPPPFSQEMIGPKVDLIIAHESYRLGMMRYVDFKREHGREVREYYVSGKTSAQIKDILKQEYKAAVPPTGTLLVGNIDQIPSWPGSSDNRWTDYPYQTLDSGNLPDTSVGRLPVHSLDELKAVFDKSIAREVSPRDIDHILITAGSDTSLGCPANVTKVGDKIKQAASSVRVVKKFKTEVNTQAVIDGYNANPNIIVYDGHGNRSGMTEIPLLMSGLDKLTNSSFPIVLDIACLNANWGSSASPRNFAESILVAANRGVAGIMASGGSGYGHDYFQTISSLMAQARQNIATDPKMNEIGQVILAAKIKHGTQDRTYWNYYGDPSSSIWQSTVVYNP